MNQTKLNGTGHISVCDCLLLLIISHTVSDRRTMQVNMALISAPLFFSSLNSENMNVMCVLKRSLPFSIIELSPLNVIRAARELPSRTDMSTDKWV